VIYVLTVISIRCYIKFLRYLMVSYTGRRVYLRCGRKTKNSAFGEGTEPVAIIRQVHAFRNVCPCDLCSYVQLVCISQCYIKLHKLMMKTLWY